MRNLAKLKSNSFVCVLLFQGCYLLHVLQEPTIKHAESCAMCPEAAFDQPAAQQHLQQPEPVQEVVRLHSLDSMNALTWPQSRRVSSAGSRSTQSSGHLHLYVDHGGDHLHLYVDQPQLQSVLPPQPSLFPTLRSTASINALVWPTSRPASSRSSGSHAEAEQDLEEASHGEAASRDATVPTAVAVLRPLPSASSIDALLWPGDEAAEQPAEQQPAVPAEPPVKAFCGLPIRLTAVGTAEVPLRGSATFKTQKQQSLLDRAAAKRALAALLAAAKASEIRGWSPKQRAVSPALSGHAEPAQPAATADLEGTSQAGPVLPSLEDIEALVPPQQSR